jgi:hypothetical protein
MKQEVLPMGEPNAPLLMAEQVTKVYRVGEVSVQGDRDLGRQALALRCAH